MLSWRNIAQERWSAFPVLMIGQAFGVVAKHFQYPAVARAATAAFTHHALEFSSQRIQARKPLFDLFQLAACNNICFITRSVGIVAEVQKLPNCFKRESQLPCVPNEREAIEFRVAIAPLTAFRATGFRHEFNLLIVANGLNFRSGPFREFTDCMH